MFEFFNVISSFFNLPAWLQNCVYILSALSLVGIGVAFSPMVALIIAIGALFIIIVLGIYSYILKERRNARQAAMGGQLEQNNLATPVAINDPARKARVEDLRKRFQEGLDKFKAVGKDIYKLPWYVVIGEPAAGKSEAIRRSDVGFPPGMQDDFQGVGGTINMNWWFTNYAVILDTAGRLLFEEVAPGTTSEWREFLKLLRKNRPNCPINGLLLVIPADGLVKGTAKSIDERAGLIARQLDTIQRELDIRFPVYVIISKCDLLNGFREFFEDLDDPEEKRQMVGWSNPDPIDKPFVPDMVDEHLQVVVERLRRRRLRLLEDPVPKDPSHRRTDEVDRLYAFPNSVALIAPNLRRYLSTIFVMGEWSAKPLFLRGIYFTSSLREGSELDQELSDAIGVSVDELPAGRIWERETSLFLRDLFLEKIFREWGLVTRATNTLRMLRQRKMALLSSATACLAIFCLLTWLGYSAMRDSIGRQSGYWLRASEGWTADNNWVPIVAGTGDTHTYKGDQPVGGGTSYGSRDLFEGGNKDLVDFHHTLRDFSQQQLNISWIFRPLSLFEGNFQTERQKAQRIVLDGSVIKPLVESTRDKIASTTITAPCDPKPEEQALLSLVRTEAGILKRHAKMDSKSIAAPDTILGPLQSYLVTRDYDSTLADLSNWTYTQGDGAGKWPPDWLSGGSTLDKNKPDYNRAIDLSIEHFRQNALLSLAGTDAKLKILVDISDILKNQVGAKEQALYQAASNQGGTLEADPSLQAPYTDLGKACSSLDDKLQTATAAGLAKDGPFSLVTAYNLLMGERKDEQDKLVAMLTEVLNETTSDEAQIKASPLSLLNTAPSPLLKEIEDRLNAVIKEIQGNMQGLDVAELKTLDGSYLNDFAGKGPVYKYRYGVYSRCYDKAHAPAPYDKLIGTNLTPLRSVLDEIDAARQEVTGYKGPVTAEFSVIGGYWLDLAEKTQVDACGQAYHAQVKQELTPLLHFPLVWPPEDTALTVDQIKEASKLLTQIHGDLHSETMGRIRPDYRAPLDALDKQVGSLDPVLRALFGMDGSLLTCEITMPGDMRMAVPVTPGDANNPAVPPAPPISDVAYELRMGTPTSGEHGNLGDKGRIRVNEGNAFVVGMPVDTIFHFHRYDPEKHEVFCGPDWSALRVLAKTTSTSASTQDDANWYIMIDDAHPEVVLNFLFQRPLPRIDAWPRKETVFPDN
jgi:hypothetical protein